MTPTLERTGPMLRGPRGRRFLWTMGACLCLLAMLDAVIWLVVPPPLGVMELYLRTNVDTEVQVHFDTGQGFSEHESVTLPLPSVAAFRPLHFPLPTVPVRHVRIDPLTVAGVIEVRSIRVVREQGHALAREIPVRTLASMDGDTRVREVPEGMEITRLPDAEGSATQLTALEPPLEMPRANPRRLVGLAALDLGVFALVGAAAFAACFGWRPRPPRAAVPPGRVRALARRWLPDPCWSSWLFVIPLVGLLGYFAAAQHKSYYLEAMVTCDREVVMQFFFDGGSDFEEQNSFRARVKPGATLQAVRFPVPVDLIIALRFDPAEGPVRVRLQSLVLRSKADKWLRRPASYVFDLRDLTVTDQIKTLTREPGGALDMTTEENADNPTATFRLPVPVSLGVDWFYVLCRTLVYVPGWLLLWVTGIEAGRRLGIDRLAGPFRRARTVWRRLSPVQAVWLVAGVSVVASCYPVIFCGKSFASPNYIDNTFQLYQRYPTLPGTTDTQLENGEGSDLGAMAWQDGPYSVVQSRALLRDHELPLWNRYNYAGLPLLGQGQSMLGDPLHGIVLAAGGRAWAWDVKFVLAKLLLAAGVGLLVLAATGCLPAALLLCFSSAFIGFFAYRLNHPAYFSLCYAPWTLFAWLQVVQAASWRTAMRWAGLLLLANWCELNSGTAKEAYMLLLCLNASGGLLLLLDRAPAESRFWRLLGLAGAGVIFCLLASPVLLTFLDTLAKSVSNYDTRHAWQLQPGMFIGLFDDIFYRQFNVHEIVLDPSANFLVLLGCLLALASCKRSLRDRVFLAVSLGAVLPLALAFGVVPPSFIRTVPLLGNVAHVDNTFSCVLLVHLFVLAGFGFRRCLAPSGGRAWHRDVLVALLLGGVLLGAYFGFAQAAQRATFRFLELNQEIWRSFFFYGYVSTVVLATVLLPYLLRRLTLRGLAFAPVAMLCVCLFLIHWRMGLQVRTAFTSYTPVLPNRVNLLATSPAIDFLHADQADPSRTVGLNSNLMPGYSGVVGLESIRGPDALVNLYFSDVQVTGLRLADHWDPAARDIDRLAAVKPFYDLLNVRYYLTLPEDNLDGVPGLVLARQLDMNVYRNDRAWPRAFFVDRLGFYRGAEEFAEHVMSGDGRPLAEIDALELRSRPALAGRLPEDQPGRTVVAATHYRLTNNRTAFDLDVPGPGVVVLTEAYVEDDIVATLNGVPASVFRVNHVFRGIFVEKPGHYHVAFKYWPRGFTLTLWAATVGAALLAAAGWWLARDRVAPAAAPANAACPPASVTPLLQS